MVVNLVSRGDAQAVHLAGGVFDSAAPGEHGERGAT